jgi:hypothetical protein
MSLSVLMPWPSWSPSVPACSSAAARAAATRRRSGPDEATTDVVAETELAEGAEAATRAAQDIPVAWLDTGADADEEAEAGLGGAGWGWVEAGAHGASRISARQMGQITLWVNHASIHSRWN